MMYACSCRLIGATATPRNLFGPNNAIGNIILKARCQYTEKVQTWIECTS